jgi:hypothetical protein
MWKKFLKLLPVLMITGCTTVATFTPLTAVEQPRNPKNEYLVETSFTSQQTALLWDTVQASLVVNGQIIPMTRVANLNNRWEGYVPVPAETNAATYRVMFDYKYNALGKGPTADTKMSSAYTLKITD